MARVKKSPVKERPPFSIHTISLTPAEVKALQTLSQEACDFIGRAISSSAIIRALIREVVKQGPSATDALFVEVEKEMKSGVLWGTKKE